MPYWEEWRALNRFLNGYFLSLPAWSRRGFSLIFTERTMSPPPDERHKNVGRGSLLLHVFWVFSCWASLPRAHRLSVIVHSLPTDTGFCYRLLLPLALRLRSCDSLNLLVCLSDLGQLVCPVLSWRRVVGFVYLFSCCEDMSDDFYAIYVSDQKPEYLNHLSFLQWISPNYLQKLGRSLGHKSLRGRRVYPLKEASIFMYRKGKFRLGFTKCHYVPGSLGDAAHLFCGADVRLYGYQGRFLRQRNPSGSESQLQQLALRWSLVIYLAFLCLRFFICESRDNSPCFWEFN